MKAPMIAWAAMSGWFFSLCQLMALIEMSQRARLDPQQIDAIIDAVSWNSSSESIGSTTQLGTVRVYFKCKMLWISKIWLGSLFYNTRHIAAALAMLSLTDRGVGN
jgi:hypothetical protein